MGPSTGVALLAAAVIITASARPSPAGADAADNNMHATVHMIGIVRNAERVLPARLRDLRRVACLPGVSASLTVLESNSNDRTRPILDEFAQLPGDCEDPADSPPFASIEIIGETAPDTNAATHAVLQGIDGDGKKRDPGAVEDARIRRIAGLRDELRDRVRPEVGKPFPDLVMLIDLDLQKLPVAAEVLRAIRRGVAAGGAGGGGGGWELQCANGHMGHFGREYYDLFATVLENGTMPMQTALAPGLSADARKAIKQQLWEHVEHNDQAVVPMRSCFGGVGIYAGEAYFAEQCRYTRGRGGPYAITRVNKQLEPTEGFQCEHVSLHECLRATLPAFRAGVVRQMTTDWRPN